MFKKVLLLVVLLVSINTAAFAAAKVQQNTVGGIPITTIMTQEVQMVAEMFTGFDNLNYEQFSKDFDTSLKSIFTPEVFKNAQKDTIDKLGAFGGMYILIWQADTSGVADTIMYRGIFAKDNDVLITVVLDRNNPAAIKIKKVSFESPLMK